MKFHYVATNKDGKVVEGDFEAENTSELLASLASKGLKPVSVKQIKNEGAFSSSKKVFNKKKITDNDKIFLTKYLGIMLRVGIDLFEAINILIADFDKSSLKGLLLEIKDSLKEGRPFYTTFAKYPQYFSDVFVNLIKAGESSGNLDGVFEKLSIMTEKEKVLRSKIRGAMIYPIILFSLSILIVIFLVTFAIPRLADVFLGGGFEPPLFSKVVFNIGLFVNTNIFIILGVGIAITAFIVVFSGSMKGKRFFYKVVLKTPVIKKIAYNIALQRFASTLSSLLRAGVPIIEALRTTTDTIGHPDIEDALIRITEDGVSKGLSLGDAFRKESAFPFVVTNLIAVSEKTGHTEDILGTLGVFYETEIENSLKTAVSFIEPVLLLFIGLIIGSIALAIIVPVYQLVGQI